MVHKGAVGLFRSREEANENVKRKEAVYDRFEVFRGLGGVVDEAGFVRHVGRGVGKYEDGDEVPKGAEVTGGHNDEGHDLGLCLLLLDALPDAQDLYLLHDFSGPEQNLETGLGLDECFEPHDFHVPDPLLVLHEFEHGFVFDAVFARDRFVAPLARLFKTLYFKFVQHFFVGCDLGVDVVSKLVLVAVV